ncbi:hypothetical protein [Novosphingobium beihaiensis]|uniref:Uncharacterized protein n=1 Tax=Novosphingobium beihaiensis TaxID=2930389 RepID=A0ABT0BJP4_9SPHN|nr:hypothetical protein [Novosphingobium beihaiensis]MCJ2185277.1 hypothetical protein [Novosphingobium beihaiensis]
MNFVSVLLYPAALLLPAAGASGGGVEAGKAVLPEQQVQGGRLDYVSQPRARDFVPQGPLAGRMRQDAEPQPARQVRIEQRMEIRITPRTALRQRPDMSADAPDSDYSVHFKERKIGKCLPIAGIAGVKPSRGSRLLLYMRDGRLVAADLERSCRARDFYSGFYLSRTPDGQLCVDRDTLLSRSGMNCKLTRIRRLVEDGR